jgi:hypothetical protein
MIPHSQFIIAECGDRYRHAVHLIRTISRNGANQVCLRCISCGQKSDWIKHDTLRTEYGLAPQEVAVWNDNLCACGGGGCQDCQPAPCDMCGSYIRIELHHYWPRALYPNAEDGPTGLLCRECHIDWHRRVKR